MRQYLFLPFDHRATFEKGLFGINYRKPTAAEVRKLREVKKIIYDAVLLAAKKGVKKGNLAILTDEGYGSHVLKLAKKAGITTAMAVEESGQDVFDFDKGKGYKAQIRRISPDFVKVLVRYNPVNKKDNEIQRKRLKELNDFLKKEKRKFLFELLVPSTKEQSAKYGRKYDSMLRPKLMLQAIKEIQNAGIRPDLWKIEGLDKLEDMKAIVKQVKSAGKNAEVIVLGRAESESHVKKWLKIGAKVKGVNGFAVGRTVFMQPLELFVKGKIPKNKVISQISLNYMKLARLWEKFKKRQ